MQPTIVRRTPLVHDIIGACIEVHRNLGPGLLESAFARCLSYEFTARGIEFQQQVAIPVNYKGVQIDCGYRADFVIGRSVLLELKSVDRVLPVHEAQILTYLKLTKVDQALLVNFNVTRLTDGLKSYLR